ncbi:MAG TPA: c-type cytochrome [Pseudomonadales bacterium]
MRSALVAACIALAGCSGAPAAGERLAMQSEGAPAAGEPLPEATLAQWSRSCALCHVRGEGGAPRVGDAADWQARLDKGEDVLFEHTIEGFNNMPPLGYCMDCSAEDFRRLIRFMAGRS